jgi:hypothetical protein
MHVAAWQGARSGALIPLPNPPRASSGPDWPALVDILLNLIQPPDGAGQTFLTFDESARICACGIEASPGWWRCPGLPMSVAGTVWRLSHLAVDDELATQLVTSRMKRAAVRSCTPIDPLNKFDRRFLLRLRRGPLPKRLLQQTLGRDYPARMFNHNCKRLAKEGYLALHDGLYSLTHKGAAAIADADLSINKSAYFARGFVEFFGVGGIGGDSRGKTFGATLLYRKYSITVKLGSSMDQPAYHAALVSTALLTPGNQASSIGSFVVWNVGLKAAEAGFLEAVHRLAALPENVGLCCRVRGR